MKIFEILTKYSKAKEDSKDKVSKAITTERENIREIKEYYFKKNHVDNYLIEFSSEFSNDVNFLLQIFEKRTVSFKSDSSHVLLLSLVGKFDVSKLKWIIKDGETDIIDDDYENFDNPIKTLPLWQFNELVSKRIELLIGNLP